MNNTLSGKLTSRGNLNGNVNTIVFAHNYNDLTNKPQINNVTLQGNKTASELGLATPSDITVTSVNEQTGDVILSGSDIDYSVGMSLNAKIDDLESQIHDSGVASVNGMTGNVTLTSNDINYSTGVTIKNKIDSVEGEIPEVYVSTVNGNSGAVTLTGSDIIYSGVQTVNGAIESVSDDVSQLSEDLSELTAQDIPMSGTDSTPTATAIGDLSSLTTGTITVNNTNVSSTQANSLTKKNGLVCLDYIFLCKALTDFKSKTWGTLPSGYIPSNGMRVVATMIPDYTSASGTTKVLMIEINTSGEIRCTGGGNYSDLGAPTANTQINIHTCYYV